MPPFPLAAWLPTLILVATFLAVGAGRVPGVRIDRPGAAIIGAALMIASSALTLEEAYRAIDHDTILLLFGVMIVVANLRLAGFFRFVAIAATRRASRPHVLLAVLVGVSGVLSALFVNDTICIVLTPLVLEIVVALNWKPTPFLLALATAANVGSAATITGNPQNMIVGGLSGISFVRFTSALAPPALLGLGLVFGVIAWTYRRELGSLAPAAIPRRRVRLHKPLLVKSLVASAGMLAGFLAGWPVPEVALLAAAFVLVTRRIKPEKIYREIDYSLLALFAGLFVVVAGFARSAPAKALYTLADQSLDGIGELTAATAVLSNLVSNVPAVLALEPLMRRAASPETAWLTLAMASTFAGNLTLVGSIANLIVAQRARPHVEIGFWEYFRVGAPITLATLALGALWLAATERGL